MAEYRIRETGEIVTNLAAQFPNTSLPMVLTQADCNALGIDPILEGPQAQATQFQVAYRDGVEEIEGKWFTKYSVVDMEQEAIDALTAERWIGIRTDRNQRLANSDWTQLPDAPLTSIETENWGSYRQALRDITTQGDPFNIEWPVLPSAGG